MEAILLKNVKELREKNLGITKIARQLNKCTDTIRDYLVFLGYLPKIPNGKGSGRKRKYLVNDNSAILFS